MLFSLCVIVLFSFLFLCLISSFMLLWSEKMLEIISVLLNLLRLVLCSSMWSVLENIPCTLEKNVYAGFFFGCNVLKYQLSLTSVVSFRISVTLLIFCLEDLFVDVSGVLKSPIIVFPSISAFMSASMFYVFVFSYIRCIYVDECKILFLY